MEETGKGGSGKEGRSGEEREEKSSSIGQGQRGSRQDDENGNATVTDIAAAIRGMTVAEGKGEGDLMPSGGGTVSKPADDDLLNEAPDEYICSLEMCLLTEDPVVASDGFTYSNKGHEGWIAHCAGKGRPLTSPKTGLPMDAAYIVNMTHRTLVREWVEGREALRKK